MPLIDWLARSCCISDIHVIPPNKTLSGIGVGDSVAVGEIVAVGGFSIVGEGVVGEVVGVKASSVACTMAATVGLGVKTASSGGEKAYFIFARNSEIRQPIRSCTKGRL